MYTLKLRRDTARRWAVLNPLLADGEPGFETDTSRLKIGDGSTRWIELAYFAPVGANATPLSEHIASETPHPVYDDGPSLALIYQNAKV